MDWLFGLREVRAPGKAETVRDMSSFCDKFPTSFDLYTMKVRFILKLSLTYLLASSRGISEVNVVPVDNLKSWSVQRMLTRATDRAMQREGGFFGWAILT